MMIFWRRGLVFLAVPKTGTHSYLASLGDAADILFRHPQGLKHMGLRRYHRQIRPLLPSGETLETFAIMREPVDWLGSWYRYRSRAEIKGKETSTRGISFEKFVADYLSETPPPHAEIGSQSGMLSYGKPLHVVDHLYKYENPEAIGAFLSDRLKVTLGKLPVLNASPDAEIALSRKLRSRLEKERGRDFELYATATG